MATVLTKHTSLNRRMFILLNGFNFILYIVTGLKNFHFFTTHVEWPKTLFVLSGLIYIWIYILQKNTMCVHANFAL